MLTAKDAVRQLGTSTLFFFFFFSRFRISSRLSSMRIIYTYIYTYMYTHVVVACHNNVII